MKMKIIDKETMQKPIFLHPRGSLNAAARRAITKAGYLLIESEKWNQCRVVIPPLPMVYGIERIALDVLVDTAVEGFRVRETFQKRVMDSALRERREAQHLEAKK